MQLQTVSAALEARVGTSLTMIKLLFRSPTARYLNRIHQEDAIDMVGHSNVGDTRLTKSMEELSSHRQQSSSSITMRVKLISIVSVTEVELSITVVLMKIRDNLHRDDDDDCWRFLLSCSFNFVTSVGKYHPDSISSFTPTILSPHIRPSTWYTRRPRPPTP